MRCPGKPLQLAPIQAKPPAESPQGTRVLVRCWACRRSRQPEALRQRPHKVGACLEMISDVRATWLPRVSRPGSQGLGRPLPRPHRRPARAWGVPGATLPCESRPASSGAGAGEAGAQASGLQAHAKRRRCAPLPVENFFKEIVLNKY